jgi:phosphoglycerol transferase
VNEFVEWCQKQDFAENTLIVIVGDHLFPNKFPGKFLARPNINNRKWVTILINPTKNPETRRRQFTSIDIAPTLLEAMGFDIAEHRFGLGVSLYSEEKTLLEIFGADSLEKELQALAHDPKFFKRFVLE